MKQKLTLLTLVLVTSMGAWAESKLSKAVAGTYLFDSSNPALTVNKGGTATITTSEGAIIIHHSDLSLVTGSRTYAAVVMKVDMPTTAPGSFSQFINLKASNSDGASIGLGVTTEGKLKGTWGGAEWSGNGGGVVTSSAVTGEHTIVMLCNDDGTTIYVDGTSTSVYNSGLKGGTKWTDLRIESTYTSCVKSVYVFSGEQKTNISDFFTELSNVVTVANEDTKNVSDNSTATRFFVASGGILTADVDYDADKIEVAGTGNVEIVSEKTLTVNAAWFDLTKITGEGDVTLDVDVTISGNKSTVATGKLIINEDKTLTLGTGQGQTNSIASFTSIELSGTIKHNNSVATLNNVTVPADKTGKIFAYDMGSTSDGFKLAGTTTLSGNLVVCSKYNFQMKVDALAGSGNCLICGTTGDNYDASGTSSDETATINIASASTYTGGVTVNNSNATVNISGNLVGSSWTKTNGTLKYAGANLNGTTLDGAILAGSSRITTSNAVNIKNLAGNNLNNTDHLYAFVGGGTINFYGTCDLTKKSDGTDCNSANIGYGSSANVIIKAGANVTAGVVLNSSTITSNAPITVEATATLTAVGSTHADNNTLLIYSTNLTNNGTINLNGANRNSKVSALSGSGTLNVASGSTITAPSVPNTMTLTGAGDVVLTSFPTSTAPTLSSWTGTVQFPDGGSSGTNLEAIFNAWGNTNSTIKLNNVSGGYLGNGGTVNPSLNILSGKTLTLNNGFSGSNSTITRVTGEGILDRQGWSNSNNHNLYITTLTDFTGTLKGTGHPIIVQKLVLPSNPEADDLLFKTSGTVTLSKLYINSEETTAYSWETKTVETVEGIYISAIDDVQLNRETAIAAVSPYEDYIGTGVGKYTVSLDEMSYTSFDDFETAVEAWATVEDCVEPTIAINTVPAGFYRFKAAARSANDNTYNWYMGSNADGIYSASTTASQATDVNTIFYLMQDANGYHPVSYVSGLYSNGTAYNAVGTMSNFTLTQAIKENNSDMLLGEYKLVNTGTNKTIVMWSNANLNAIDGNNDWSGWTIEPVEYLPVTLFNVGDAGHGFASFYTPVAISSLPEGVKAYIASVEGDRIQFTNVTSIPADNGVVLYQPTYSSDPVNLTIGDASADATDNVLDGSAATIALASLGGSGVLTLQDGGSGLGFYKFNGTNLTGFKAYVNINDVTGVKSFVLDFDDIVDGINSLNPALSEGEEAIYNLAGQRLNKIQKGINIVNGKKIAVK